MPKPIDQLGLGPKREAVQTPDGNWRVTIIPPQWSGYSANTIMLTSDQYQRYMLWQNNNLMIQEALPELSNAEREILMSGIGPEEWNATMKDDE